MPTHLNHVPSLVLSLVLSLVPKLDSSLVSSLTPNPVQDGGAKWPTDHKSFF